MDLGLDGKHVFLTGASGGIGVVTAKLFLQHGALVSMQYNTSKTALQDLVDVHPDHAIPVQADVSNESSVMSAVQQAASRSTIDILVLNHGIFPPDSVPLRDMTLEHWQKTIDINLTGCFLFAREFLRQAATGAGQGAPSIVIVGSTSGMFGEAGHVDYSSSKAALHGGFLRTLKNEIYHVHPRGRVNVVAPGWVMTRMAEETVNKDPQVLTRACQTIAMKKVAQPLDVANAILFLSSDKVAGHITGEVMEVTGGMEGRLLHPSPPS